ncbi:MAG: hypothetical protein R6X02_19275 [Enhygromyxa sp.]
MSVIAVIALTLIAQPARGSGAGPDDREPALETVDHAAPAAARPLALIENRRILSYPFEQVWPTAIRYLRIDRGFEVTDRDEEAGYMLFEFPVESGRMGNGSVEMFATEDAAGRASVSISVNTGAGPVHLPNSILDGIAAKVRAERGQPVAPPKREQPPPKDKDKPEDDNSVPLLPPAQDP